jgi:hippurate hydrolase
MPIVDQLQGDFEELRAIRRDLHAHPELGFAEERTAAIVASKLAEYGCEVARGLAKTGVVGTLRAGRSRRAVGLRADMDALPIEEENGFAHRSTAAGRMHACGHDGHTAILLGAAKHLARTRQFEGVVHFIFQPAEEGLGGAQALIAEGLFAKFPCEAVFALHNRPGLPVGAIATRPGPLLAASDRWDIRVRGRGTHAGYPHCGVDPFVAAAAITLALQTVASRNVDPLDAATLSIGFMRGGSSYNAIPDEVHIGGTSRSFTSAVRDLVEKRMGEIARSVASAHGASAEIIYRRGYPPTVNHAGETEFAASVAVEVCGGARVTRDFAPSLGAEDFSYMLASCPGAMVWLGNGEEGAFLHNARYDFNDLAIPVGAGFFVRLAERFLARPQG